MVIGRALHAYFLSGVDLFKPFAFTQFVCLLQSRPGGRKYAPGCYRILTGASSQ